MKKYNLVIKEEANQEIIDAYFWYETKSEGLGERFFLSLDQCFDTICYNPTTYQKVHKTFRKAIVAVFPYVVLYEKRNKDILVYAVFHTAQDPDLWKKKV